MATAAALPLLMGCGAGGGAGLSFAPVGSGPITSAEIDRIQSDLERLSTQITESDVSLQRPNVSVASYNGFVGMDLDSVSSVTGRISMVADFTVDSVTGSAGDFSVFDDSTDSTVPIENLTGVLPITNGSISGTNMTATMNGSLGSAAGTYGVTSTLNGEFADIAGQNIVGGIVSGSLANPNSTTTQIDGGFVAAQN